jgi:hypothetical protein
VAGTRRACAFDEALRTKRQELRPNNARGFHAARKSNQQHEERNARLQHADHDHEERQPQHGEYRIGGAHQDRIECTARVARDTSNRDPRRTRHGCRGMRAFFKQTSSRS